MRTSQFVTRNLTYYWRTNLAVVLGVATAVAVLAGALLVGDSVRASLRDLFLQRLGNTDYVITAPNFFREQLAEDIRNDRSFATGGFAAACPLIALEGTVTHESSQRVGSRVKVYGVDERFWRFQSRPDASPRNRDVLVSESLARELSTHAGDSLTLRVEKPSDIPAESLHSKKEDLGSTLSLKVRETLAADALGEFSVQPQQTGVRAVFVPLNLLQKEIAQEDKANLILLSETSRNPATQAAKTETVERILKERTSLEDFGINLRLVSVPTAIAGGPAVNQSKSEAPSTHPPSLVLHPSISLETDSKMISDSLAKTAGEAARDLSLSTAPVLSYLANSIKSGERSIPYSLVTAIDEDRLEELRVSAPNKLIFRRGSIPYLPVIAIDPHEAEELRKSALDAGAMLAPIILNEWTARDLGVQMGDTVSLEYYVWHEGGRLETKTEQFQLIAVVPIKGLAADKDLVPDYPGITGSENLADWDPPFPVDLKQIRKQDEDYWDQYHTTPKAFIPLAKGQELWGSRFGSLTSMRFTPGDQPVSSTLDAYAQRLRSVLDPPKMGFAVMPVRAQGLEAARGATDFGEYFLYFSFFLVISALLLTALFFKLGIEQRLREIGVLQAVGFPAAKIRRIFLAEGIILAVLGSVIGLAGAVGYGQLMMLGLRTWWVDAVGTTMLSLHISPVSLLLGAGGGVLAAMICVVWTLRRVGKQSTRSLLTGALKESETGRRGDGEKGRRLFTSLRAAVLLTLLGGALLIAAALNLIGQVAGFFGGGLLLLAALLCYQSAWLRGETGNAISGSGWWPVLRLGFRNATYRPGRSVLCIALIASAAFIIVSVDAFRRREGTTELDRKSGSGGYPLLAESLLPLVHDPNSAAGREALNLATDRGSSPLKDVSFTRFRVRPGDDASCLNLYQPRNPKIIAPADNFVHENRFAFQSSVAASNEEKENPWALLNREFADGAVPVIADANSMTYVLHLKLGEDLVLQQGDRPIRLRLVGALADSIFQSELLMSEKNFLRLFPDQEGYRLFLLDIPAPGETSAIAAALEDRLSDFGFDVVPTGERLANFHRVENTYLSTFQMLGGLGLLLGTLGMSAVLLRNVLERRRELALLRAVGYNSSHFTLMAVAENALLLFCGLVTGIVCALLAIAPVFLSRHAQLPSISLGMLLLAVLISGLIASLVATWAALRSPLLPALRAE
ncbi:MAG: FtsX-like permease family protein [Pyrinomonadaceae bacterium]